MIEAGKTCPPKPSNMTYDLVDRSQHYVRRAGEFLRTHGVAPQDSAPRRTHDGALRDGHFVGGGEQVEGLAAAIEALTGQTLDSRVALDYGCGFGRLAIPLATRCEHVYGLDISADDLRAADENAQRLNVANVDWMDAREVASLSGRYNFVLSHWVFPHIPSRQGERLFATLVSGLRPGGIGAIHVAVKPRGMLGGTIRAQGRSRRGIRRRLPRFNWTQAYLMMNSNSLNQLGSILSEAGINRWLVQWHGTGPESGVYPSAMLIFEKPNS